MVKAQHNFSNVKMKRGNSKSKQIEHKCLFFVPIKVCLSDIKKTKRNPLIFHTISTNMLDYYT